MTGNLASAIDVAQHTTGPGALRAVDYLRVSTEEQTQGYGIAYTGRLTKAHIEKKQWVFVRTYADEGYSGSLEAHERPDVKSLMEAARRTPRPFDVVVVPEVRAIGRAGRAFWPWVWELEDLGVFVAIVKGDYDNTTDDGRSRMRKEADRAEDERIAIRDRTQGGIQEKAVIQAADGGFAGGSPPFGWRIADQGKKRESRYALDDQHEGGTWHTLASARTLVVEYRGDITRAAVALNARGALTRSGVMWTRENLKARLFSQAVLESSVTFRDAGSAQNRVRTGGDGKPLFGETVVITIPPAFTPAQVQELRDSVQFAAYAARPGSRAYPLSGRIVSACKAFYTGCAPAGRERRYRCMGKHPKHAGADVCTCRQLDADEVEAFVWGKLVRLLSDPEELRLRAEEWVGLSQQSRVNFADRLADLDRQITQKDRAIGAVMAAAAQDADSPEEAIRMATASLKAQRGELAGRRAQVAAWQQESDAAQGRAQELQRLAELASKRLTNISLRDKAEIIGMMDVRLTLLEPVPDAARSCPVTDWFRSAELDIPVLTDEGWSRAGPIVAALHRPDRRMSQRRVMEGLLHKARQEASWHTLTGFGNPQGLRAAWSRWSASGAWALAVAALDGADTQPVPPRLPRMHMDAEIVPGLILSTEKDLITRSPRAACDQVLIRIHMTLTP